MALTKVAASTPQRRAEVLALAIFLGVREQQVAGVRTWGEHKGPCWPGREAKDRSTTPVTGDGVQERPFSEVINRVGFGA